MSLPKALSRAGLRPRRERPDPGCQVVQGWLPVQDVRQDLGGAAIVRKDGALVAAVRVQPVPFALLSAGERARRISALHEAIQGIDGSAQISVVPRPLDLDAYIRALDAALAEAQGVRRTLLTDYARYVRTLAQGGDAIEHRFYILLARKGPTAAADVAQQASELIAALGRAEIQALAADDQECRELLFAAMNPSVAAFERALPAGVAPVYRPENDDDQDTDEGGSTWHSST